jgi:hypothetical protein
MIEENVERTAWEVIAEVELNAGRVDGVCGAKWLVSQIRQKGVRSNILRDSEVRICTQAISIDRNGLVSVRRLRFLELLRCGAICGVGLNQARLNSSFGLIPGHGVVGTQQYSYVIQPICTTIQIQWRAWTSIEQPISGERDRYAS